MLSFEYNRTSNVFVDINVDVKNHNFKFPLILDKYNIVIGMQKLKVTREITSAIDVECLHSSMRGGRVVRWHWVNCQCRDVLLIWLE